MSANTRFENTIYRFVHHFYLTIGQDVILPQLGAVGDQMFSIFAADLTLVVLRPGAIGRVPLLSFVSRFRRAQKVII